MNTSSRLIFAATLALVAVGAFFVGRASSTNSADSAASASRADAPPPRLDRTDRPDSARSFRDTTRPANARGLNADSLTATAITEMQSIFDSTDPLDRTQKWLDFLNTLEPGQFEAVVHAFRTGGLTEDHMSEYGMMLTAWAGIDPLAALDYASENTGSPFARNTILTSWATQDPNAAIAWAESNHEGTDANPWMVGVIRGIAPSDPALASQLMEDLPYSRERGEALGTILPQILKQGEDTAKAWALNISDERLRDGAVARLAENLARENPAEAADWLASAPGDGARRAMDDVIGTWADRDFGAAQSYFEKLPGGELRTSALRGLTSQLAVDDPTAAADLLDRHAADADDRVYQSFVWRSRRQDPVLAANYIGQIGDRETRDATYRRLVGRWIRDDAQAAGQWLESASLPESVAGRLQRRLQRAQR